MNSFQIFIILYRVSKVDKSFINEPEMLLSFFQVQMIMRYLFKRKNTYEKDKNNVAALIKTFVVL